ncbi:uncharacterized protein LOC119666243 [Teleopsis dalmanni]|uniref:uncharacterized protein LOC119666243 n=1 Tax=Teleopsis dalmanni TaxID=139649 RepID=UPI0018CCC758|nr:uncharacterized protein LOC119666243 [Teleopsis dalmanni]
MEGDKIEASTFLKLKCSRLVTQLKDLEKKLSAEFLSNCHEVQLQLYIDSLQQLNTKFDAAQSSLEQEDFHELESEVRDNFEQKYIDIKSAIIIELSHRQTNIRNSTSRFLSNDEAPSINVKYSRSRLPELQLPTFSGDIKDWPHFISMFGTIVDESIELSNLEKLQHLRSCLKGSALDAIKSLEVSDANYAKSLLLLSKKFDNKRLIFQAHIKEIFGLRRVEPNAVVDLRRLSDKMNSHLHALSTLGSKEQIADGLMVHLVSQRLDPASQAKWEEKASIDAIPTWDQMADFLDKRCKTLEHVDYATKFSAHNKTKQINLHPIARKVFIATNSKGCTFCESDDHFIYSCCQFTNLSPKLRLTEARKLSLCLNCLKKGHQLKQCKSSFCCICSRPHHTLLHLNDRINDSTFSSSNDVPLVNPTSNTKSKVQAYLVSTNASQQTQKYPSSECVLLATAIILIRNRAGSYIPCRALLDSASQLHFITKSLANTLQLKTTKCATVISGITDRDFVDNSTTELSIKSRFGNYTSSITAVITSKITNQHPSTNVNTTDWNIPKNLQLADPAFYKSQRIDILIGAALFFDLLYIGQIRLAPQLPVLQKTLFGWVVSGGNQHSSISSSLATFKKSSTPDDRYHSLDLQVRKFWELESCFDPVIKITKEHLDCQAHFQAHFSRLVTGEYSVRLPLKLDIQLLGDSYQQAARRFYNLERKLQRNTDLKTQYSAFIKEYLQLNHMSPLTDEELTSPKYFLPHHCVIKESSSSTKLRVVFDGSAATSTGYSLNDILMSGPTIQPNLIDLLIRFRSFPIAVTADICKMYRGVRVTRPDNFLQCILWRNDMQEPLKVFKLDTVTYGTKPAAFLAVRAMQQLAVDESLNFPIGSKITLRDFYVDDLISGGNCIDDVQDIVRQTTALLNKGNFKLRKWCSNQLSALDDIPEDDREPLLNFDDGSEFTKTLGLLWDPTNDKFLFTFAPHQDSRRTTKRSVLSVIARLYDPLGLVGPLISKAKIFLQCLWKHTLDWDESLPNQLHTAWTDLYNRLHIIQRLEFPRCVSISHASLELHAFCDASLNAYGVCIYVVSKHGSSESANLLCSKSRVAPLKTLTVPKLELCAAALLAQLIHQISSLNIFNAEIHCWSDSSIVLSWIRSEPSTFNVFVANRVSKIQHLTKGMTWHHVPTDLNPADILSK